MTSVERAAKVVERDRKRVEKEVEEVARRIPTTSTLTALKTTPRHRIHSAPASRISLPDGTLLVSPPTMVVGCCHI